MGILQRAELCTETEGGAEPTSKAELSVAPTVAPIFACDQAIAEAVASAAAEEVPSAFADLAFGAPPAPVEEHAVIPLPSVRRRLQPEAQREEAPPARKVQVLHAPVPHLAAAPPAEEESSAAPSDEAVALLMRAPTAPAPADAVLLVGLLWGGESLVALEQVPRGADLRASRFAGLPGGLPAALKLLSTSASGHTLFVAPGWKPEVAGPDGRLSAAQLSRSGRLRRVEAPMAGSALELRPDESLTLQLTPQLQLLARYVAPGEVGSRTKGRFDALFGALLLMGTAAVVAFAFRARGVTLKEGPLSPQMLHAPVRFVQASHRPKPPPRAAPESPKVHEAPGAEAAKAAGDEGKRGLEAKRNRKNDPSGVDAKEAGRRAVMRRGLLALLGGPRNSLSAGGLGGMDKALGGVRGDGGAAGNGGLGVRGLGGGGGGVAVGIAGAGTRGRGQGGLGNVDLGGKGKEETQFVPGRTVVVGGLPRDVINRIIQRHLNEVRYCYERELSRSPGMYGKVSVSFVIGGDGRVPDATVQQSTLQNGAVEGCIVDHVKRWTFPAPEGGSTVQVTYPYVFKSEG